MSDEAVTLTLIMKKNGVPSNEEPHKMYIYVILYHRNVCMEVNVAETQQSEC